MTRRTRTLLLVALAVGLGLAGLLFTRNLVDFPVYYSAGRSLLDGRTDLYAPDFALGRVMDYRYPPFFLLALTPLWLLPYDLSAYLWYLMSIAQIAACVVLMRSLIVEPAREGVVWLITGLAVAQYFVMLLHYGNAHLLALFLLFVSLALALKRRDLAPAFLMALAITIKLVPALLLPYFALQRRWRFLALVGTLLIAINMAPVFYFGFRENAELLKTWYRQVIAEQEFHETNGPINLSLKGQLRRYLSSVDYSQRIDGDINYPSVSVASLTKQQTDSIWIVVAAVAFVAGLYLISRVGEATGESRKAPLEALKISLLICLMLLIGPLTSKIYFAALLWPVLVLAGFGIGNATPSGSLSRRIVITVAAVNVVLPLLPGRWIQRLLLVLGVDFYMNCLLLAALAVVVARLRRTDPGGRDELQTPVR
jgi:hypothetical protein